MNKKQSKRQRDIKTKLMAAVCMLLVSSIMMVSTTYAWFTLSTAPEVTGITTAVGANGNLEMALLPLSGNTSEITANQGDSMMSKTAKEANVTWGNLVDLRSGYGLDQIVLYPSELNVVAAEEVNTPDKIATTGILKTPTYGADGRIDDLLANTFTGVYTDQGGFYQTVGEGTEANSSPMGVRGIGTISSMSPRELAFRLAMSNGSTAASQAGGAASAAMSNNGAGVAQIALDHATGNDVYDDNDVQWLINIVDGLLGGNGKTGSVAYMETALKQYILAASIALGAADANFQTIVDAVNQETVTVYDMADGKINSAAGTEVTLTVPSAIAGYITNLQSIKTKLTSAKTTLVNLQSSDDSFDWDEISDPMATLININSVIFEGPDKNGDGQYDDIDMTGALADKMGFGLHVIQKGLVMKMRTGSGIFAELADFCGDFTSSFTMKNVSVSIPVDSGDPYTANVDELEVTMIADTALPTADADIYLAEARAAVGEFDGTTSGGGNSPISDFYGYIIDMAFRTNAANSWLQLQQEGIDRIYSDGTNTNTQGGGASMTFTSGDPDNFSVGKMKDLMSAIKIVFFDPSAENEIVGYAKLDNVNVAKEDATSVTMYLVMCDEDGNTLEGNGAIQIMQLNQNEIHQLSVLVYLDGNNVGNDDVATTARSMTGSMNLQFSSSANLVAMDYANLKSGNGGALNGGAGEGDDDEPTATEVDVNIDSAYTATGGYGTYGALTGICVKIMSGTDEVTDATATVTINDGNATYVSGAGWVVAASSAPTEAVAVVVTPKA